MSTEDKLKALGEKAKAAFHDLKGEAHLTKDKAERKLDESGGKSDSMLDEVAGRAGRAWDELKGEKRRL